MEEEKNGNMIIKKNKIPNRTFKKSNTLNNRHRSIKQYNNQMKYEKIIPKKRFIKSREKDVKNNGNTSPIIKRNSFSKKIKENNMSNPNIKIVKKDNKNLILPNFNSKKSINSINNFKEINNINNKLYENNNLKEDEIKNNEFITKFYEEFINVINSITNKNLFISLLNSFNKKYILFYDINTSLHKITDDNFNVCLKYIYIIITILIFLSKDETSYKNNNQRLKELLEQFTFVALKNVKLKTSPKFKTLINKIKPNKKNLTQSENKKETIKVDDILIDGNSADDVGDLVIKENLSEAIYSATQNLVEDNFNDYLRELKEVVQYSSLKDLSENEVDGAFVTLLTNSITYMVMKRCGLDPSEEFNVEL